MPVSEDKPIAIPSRPVTLQVGECLYIPKRLQKNTGALNLVFSSSPLNLFSRASHSSLGITFSTMANDLVLPIIDLSGYINDRPEDKERVISEVKDACKRFGFFQVKGHGVPLGVQQGLIRSLDRFFGLPKEEKTKLSFLNNPCRRGYEASGDSMREGDALPDSKEVPPALSYAHVGTFWQ